MKLVVVVRHCLQVIVLCNLVHISEELHLASCKVSLGVEDSSRVPDSALSASSSYDSKSLAAKYGRLHSQRGGGAWCAASVISDSDRTPSSEYLEVDLASLHVITHVLTQGRDDGGKGQEMLEAFQLHYARDMKEQFKLYRDFQGRAVFEGNRNAHEVLNTTLMPPIVASKLRILPYSHQPRAACLRLGLLGCPFSEGVLSYSIPQGMTRGNVLELVDHTYDGHEDTKSGQLRNGLGQLVDGRFGGEPIHQGVKLTKGFDWVGWKRSPSSMLSSVRPHVQLMFNFDCIRLFRSVSLFTNNHFSKDVQLFSLAKIYFSNEEDKFADDRLIEHIINSDLKNEVSRNITLSLDEQHGSHVMIELYFTAKWIMISEITFDSEPFVQKRFTTATPFASRSPFSSSWPSSSTNSSSSSSHMESKHSMTMSDVTLLLLTFLLTSTLMLATLTVVLLMWRRYEFSRFPSLFCSTPNELPTSWVLRSKPDEPIRWRLKTKEDLESCGHVEPVSVVSSVGGFLDVNDTRVYDSEYDNDNDYDDDYGESIYETLEGPFNDGGEVNESTDLVIIREQRSPQHCVLEAPSLGLDAFRIDCPSDMNISNLRSASRSDHQHHS